MSKAIQDLVHEHEAIRFSLRILATMAEKAERGDPGMEGDELAFVGFLREFADACHHGKEEGMLFPALEASGVAREAGPLGVMLAEHDEGRALIRRMAAAAGASPQAPGGGREFAEAARLYIRLLDSHIEKENTVLFPMAERVLEPEVLESLYEGFEAHERDVIGQGRHEALHAMLDDFERRYL